MTMARQGPPTVLVLGGYGNAGRRIVRLLLEETDARVITAGRSETLARAHADRMNEALDRPRVFSTALDASDAPAVRAALDGVDLLLVASSTSRHASAVARAALDAGVDYLDIHYAPGQTDAVRTLAPEVEAAALCFVIEGGFHPGLPAALVRHVANGFERLDTARVAAAVRIDWRALDVGADTVREFAREIARTPMLVYRDGAWRRARWWSTRDFATIHFGVPIDARSCAPVFLEELRRLPELYPTLRELGFYMAGFGGLVDWVVMPAAALLARTGAAGERLAGRWLGRSLRSTSEPPYLCKLQVEAVGRAAGRATRVTAAVQHGDAYQLTAIPAVATVLQLMDGAVREPGVHLQAHLVRPPRFLADMRRMGVELEETWDTGSAVDAPDDATDDDLPGREGRHRRP